jgi:hypothetical protein
MLRGASTFCGSSGAVFFRGGSALTRYSPGVNPLNLYAPFSSVVIEPPNPASPVFITWTIAPAADPPFESMMVPEMLPKCGFFMRRLISMGFTPLTVILG